MYASILHGALLVKKNTCYNMREQHTRDNSEIMSTNNTRKEFKTYIVKIQLVRNFLVFCVGFVCYMNNIFCLREIIFY